MQYLKTPKNPYIIPALIIGAVLLVAIVLAGIFSSAAPAPAAQASAPIAAAPVAAAPVAAVAPVVAAPAPVIVNAPAPSSGASDMLLGAAAGYMIGSAGNRNAAPVHAPAPARPVVHKTVIQKTVVVQQRPRPIVRPQPIAKSYTASRVSLAKPSSSRSSRR